MFQNTKLCPIHQQSIIIGGVQLNKGKNQSAGDGKFINVYNFSIQLSVINKCSNQILINCQQQQIDKRQENIQKQVILIGEIGSGRTTIFNKCCKQNQETSRGGDFCTKNPFFAKSAYGKGFIMFDTPGIVTNQNNMNHVCGIAKALNSGDYHQIIICVECAMKRPSDIYYCLENFLSNKLHRFTDLITIAVTRFDYVRGKEAEFQIKKIQKSLQNNMEDDCQEICNKIDQILQYQKGRNCSLSNTELIRFFDLFEISYDFQEYLDSECEGITASFRRTGQIIKNFINSIDKSHQQIVDIIHLLTLFIKDQFEICLKNFEQEILNKLTDDQNEEMIYYAHSKIKEFLLMDMKYLQQRAQNIIYNSSEYVDFIRKCPFCGLIWIKVDKCTDQAYCGEYSEKDDDQLFQQSKQMRRFKFNISNGVLQIQENSQVIEQTRNRKQMKPTICKSSLLGCKQRFIWSELPPLKPNLIEELTSGAFQDCIAKIHNETDDQMEKYFCKKIDETLKKIEITKL